MTQARVGERERAGAEWFGAPREGQVPVRASGTGAAAAKETDGVPAGRRWMRRLGRVLRDAAIAVAILAMVPVGIVTISNGYVWRTASYAGNTLERLRQAEPSRAFAPSRDQVVTPMQAGLALAALSPATTNEIGGPFPLRPVPDRAVRPWDQATLTTDMFGGIRNSSWKGPNSTSVLEAAAKGLSRRELDYLRMVATAPLWQRYDLVARAPAIDILGGRFEIPYRSDAIFYQMPMMRFAATKELAYAGVSRAAYHLAAGDRAQAEAALKSIIGFGFAMIDNGTTLIDGLIGRVIVGIGRDGLERFYTLTHDPRATTVAAAAAKQANSAALTPGQKAQANEWRTRPVDAWREMLLSQALDATLPRAVRMETLTRLSLSSCTNVRELVFGTGSDITRAYEAAGRDLARFPSERALLDMALHTTDRARSTTMRRNGPEQVIVGAATVAGIVLQNPRMAFCARIITGGGNPD